MLNQITLKKSLPVRTKDKKDKSKFYQDEVLVQFFYFTILTAIVMLGVLFFVI